MEEKLLFTEHLSTLLCGGVPIADALESLIEAERRGELVKVMRSVVSDIRNGQTLSFALNRFPTVFDPFYRSLVEVGEATGTLEKSLGLLAIQMGKKHELRRKVVSVLLYPGFVIAVAGIVGGFISVFVLPKLIPLFASFDAKLPLSTTLLLAFSSLMKAHGILIVLLIAAFLTLFRIVISVPRVRPFWHRFLLRLPIFGKFLRNVRIAVFCHDMSIMIGRGLPLSQALSIERDVTNDSVFRGYAERLGGAVSRGRTLESELLGDSYHHIPLLVGKMIGVGESTGRLEESFGYLADFFEKEADASAKSFSTLLEPMLIVLVGGLVAFVALSIIVPLYTLTGSIHR